MAICENPGCRQPEVPRQAPFCSPECRSAAHSRYLVPYSRPTTIMRSRKPTTAERRQRLGLPAEPPIQQPKPTFVSDAFRALGEQSAVDSANLNSQREAEMIARLVLRPRNADRTSAWDL